MARVKRGVVKRARHKKIIKMAKGYRGRAKNCYRIALQRVEKALQYAYRDRRNRKRDFRNLWVIRINAAVRQHSLTYSKFVGGLIRSGINLDRKVLADLAVNHKDVFKQIIQTVKDSIAPIEKSSMEKSSVA